MFPATHPGGLEPQESDPRHSCVYQAEGQQKAMSTQNRIGWRLGIAHVRRTQNDVDEQQDDPTT